MPVSGVLFADFVKPKEVNEVDQFQMSGKQLPKQIHTPFFKCLRQNCMVCVGKGIVYDLPGFFLLEMLLVDKDSQQLHDSQSRVGIVQLYAGFFGKVLPGKLSTGILSVNSVPSDDVLQSRRY